MRRAGDEQWRVRELWPGRQPGDALLLDGPPPRRQAVEEQGWQFAEKAAEATGIQAAKALFERHIALDEVQAQTRAATPPGRRAPITPAAEKSARK